jgi:hypothetical protein
LPLGETTSPRIWVRESQLDQARRVLAEWREEQVSDIDVPEEPVEDSEPADLAPPPQADETEEPAVRFRVLSAAFFVVALGCITYGGIWAWRNRDLLALYSATTQARLAGTAGGSWEVVHPAPRDPNLPLKPSPLEIQRLVDARYDYLVDGQTHSAWLQVGDVSRAPKDIQIRYDPSHPDNCLIGPIAPPWLVLLLGLAVGGFLLFVGWQFR